MEKKAKDSILNYQILKIVSNRLKPKANLKKHVCSVCCNCSKSSKNNLQSQTKPLQVFIQSEDMSQKQMINSPIIEQNTKNQDKISEMVDTQCQIEINKYFKLCSQILKIQIYPTVDKSLSKSIETTRKNSEVMKYNIMQDNSQNIMIIKKSQFANVSINTQQFQIGVSLQDYKNQFLNIISLQLNNQIFSKYPTMYNIDPKQNEIIQRELYDIIRKWKKKTYDKQIKNIQENNPQYKDQINQNYYKKIQEDNYIQMLLIQAQCIEDQLKQKNIL